jgi:hypothetical protein
MENQATESRNTRTILEALATDRRSRLENQARLHEEAGE